MSDLGPPPEEPTPGQPPAGSPDQPGQAPPPGSQPGPPPASPYSSSYGSYGSAPPPPPVYSGGPGVGGYSAPSAMRYGWEKFTERPSQLLVPALVVALAVIALEVVVQVLLRATLLGTHTCTQTVVGQRVQTTCGPGFVPILLGAGIAGFVVSLIAQALGAGLIKAGLNVADNRPVSTGEVFSYVVKGNVLLAALIVSVATAVGFVLCYVPGLIIGFLLTFTMFFVVDQDMSAMQAVRASYAFTTSHLGATLLFYLLAVLAIIVGALLCLVGLLAAIPVVLVGAAYTFRVLHNRPVAPAV